MSLHDLDLALEWPTLSCSVISLWAPGHAGPVEYDRPRRAGEALDPGGHSCLCSAHHTGIPGFTWGGVSQAEPAGEVDPCFAAHRQGEGCDVEPQPHE
jgi:hypothetical protein